VLLAMELELSSRGTDVMCLSFWLSFFWFDGLILLNCLLRLLW